MTSTIQFATRSSVQTLTALPPLSVYVHFPWCVRKCPYCDFNSHTVDGTVPEDRYLDAVQADLEAQLPDIWGRVVQTVFIGGGTPSLLSPAGIERLLAMLRARLRLAADAEITLEANPGTADAAHFAAYRAAGVNRISLGIQSFDDATLQALGRIHDGDAARRAIEVAQRHFARINLDLMFALPRQSLADCEADVSTALAFGTEHLSLYQLTMEPNTLFAKFPPADLPDDDLAADMQDWIVDALGAKGLQRYEISAYARPGAQCQHNLNYWRFGDYLGIGAGAHGKLSFHDRIVRRIQQRHPATYIEQALAGTACIDERRLTRDELPFEFMLNALRLIGGVPATLFEERTGLGTAAIGKQLLEAEQRGLLAAEPTRLAATPLGLRFLNELQAMFLGGD